MASTQQKTSVTGRVSIDSRLFFRVLGRKGATMRDISAKTKTRLEGDKDTGEFTIVGPSAQAVRKAATYLKQHEAHLLDRRTPSYKPTLTFKADADAVGSIITGGPTKRGIRYMENDVGNGCDIYFNNSDGLFYVTANTKAAAECALDKLRQAERKVLEAKARYEGGAASGGAGAVEVDLSDLVISSGPAKAGYGGGYGGGYGSYGAPQAPPASSLPLPRLVSGGGEAYAPRGVWGGEAAAPAYEPTSPVYRPTTPPTAEVTPKKADPPVAPGAPEKKTKLKGVKLSGLKLSFSEAEGGKAWGDMDEEE